MQPNPDSLYAVARSNAFSLKISISGFVSQQIYPKNGKMTR